MKEIYFKIDLPKDAKRPKYLQVDKDGFVCRILDTMVNPLFSLQVIGDSVLPPHGRLIDADFAITQEKNYCKDCDNWNGIRCKTCEHDYVMMILDDAPTVIEAST